jgi:hypothetical protein
VTQLFIGYGLAFFSRLGFAALSTFVIGQGFIAANINQ